MPVRIHLTVRQSLVLDRHQRLAGAVQSEVTVILEDHGAGQTLMTIEHERLPNGQIDPHQRGWGAIAAQLGEALVARSR